MLRQIRSLFAKSGSVDRVLDYKRYRGRRLGIEALEDRRVLAVLIGSGDDLDSVNNALPPGGQNLGSEPTVSIQNFSMGFGDPRDVFVYRAHSTGKLFVSGSFNFDVQDSTQTSLVGGLQTSVVIPVVGGEQYWIRLTNPDPDNDEASVAYDLEIENFAAPIPASVSLSPASDTGISNSDGITSDDTPTFFIQDDLGTFFVPPPGATNFGTIDSNAAQGYDVELVITNLTSGAETFVNATRLGTSSTWTATAPALPGMGEEYLVSARTRVMDAVTAGGGGPNIGNSLLGVPIFVTIDTGTPGAPVAPNLLTASDTGMFSNDNVTNKMQPAFSGAAPLNTNRVFVFARQVINGVPGPAELVGSTDDFILVPAGEFSLNVWEVTVEPLADAVYDIFAVYEAVTGELSPNGTPLRVEIDTTMPNTPVLDLRNDTGGSLSDEITSDNTPDVSMTTTDPAISSRLFTDNLKFRIYDRFENNAEVLIYDSATDAAADAISSLVGLEAMFTSATQLTRTLGPLADGVHNLKLEVEDRAGNISGDYLLEVFVDTQAPNAVMPNLLDASDAGMFNTDNVTNKMQPAFDGVGEINTKVFVYATRISPTTGVPIGPEELVGEGLVGSENTNGVAADGLGRWEVTVEPLVDAVYDITVRFEDLAGNITGLGAASEEALRIVIDTLEPNTPFLDLLDDTGRHDNDNITKDNTPQVSMTTTDPNIALALALFTDNLKFRIYDRFENSSQEVLIYDSAQDAVADAVMTAGDMFTALTQLTRTLPVLLPVNPAIVGNALADGVHNLKLEVEDRAGNFSHDFLLSITVDTTPPPVSFGLPDAASVIDGLAAESDSGVTTQPATYADRITNDTTPRLWGRAEADSVVRVFLDRNGNGIVDLATDTFLGQTVAVPFDGNDAYPDGYWEVTSVLDLNEIVGLPKDGLRRLLVTGEDVAGNPMPMNNQISTNVDELQIFIDTQGPQVTNVQVGGDPDYDLFDPKPSTDGPTPLVNSLVISFRDLPTRLNQAGTINDFLYDTLDAITAAAGGNYQLVGDHVGFIPITANPVVDNIIEKLNATVSAVTNASVFTAAGLVGAAVQPAVGDYVRFTSGPNNGQLRQITAYNAATGQITVDAAFGANPAIGNTFAVVTAANLNMATVTLNFANPLPDDRYTLTVQDNLTDPAGNNLDGESNADEPQELPTFPSGDEVPGGDFIARFTVDSRPEMGTFVAQNISIDINGNYVWDPANAQIGNDATNVDLSFTLPVAGVGGVIGLGGYNVHDLVFAGRFSLRPGNGGATSDGFDTLAAYGNSAELGGVFRWLVDRNHDGVVNVAQGDILTTQPALANFNIAGAIPVAGNFVGGVGSDDEIGLYNQGKWAFDTNKNFVIEAGEVFTNGLLGHPIVGDFDGDGLDDLAVFNSNQIFFNFANDGLTDAADQSIIWGYPGVLDRPVAADLDRDGIDDIGLWVPRNSSATPRPQSEWYFKLSDDLDREDRVTGSATTLNHPFTPVPFGDDLYAEFGDELALPIIGNFDPPVSRQTAPPDPQGGIDGDFDGDGVVGGRDFLTWQRSYGSTQNLSADGNHNGQVDGGDLTMWQDALVDAPAALSSDMDSDGDVDGRDFLAIQRSSSSGAALASWQQQYGTSAALQAVLTVDDNDEPVLAALSLAVEEAPSGESTADSSLSAYWVVLPGQGAVSTSDTSEESLAEQAALDEAVVDAAFDEPLGTAKSAEIADGLLSLEEDAEARWEEEEQVADEVFNELALEL